MSAKLRKVLSLAITISLLFQQAGSAQIAAEELNIANHLARMASSFAVEKFRPLHLRYFSYDALNDNFKVLLDKGDLKNLRTNELENTTKDLLNYFLVGVTLPDEMFWVNLRPDSEDQIIDPWLEQTDVGKIMLEADLQLKKDTAAMTSPQTPEGREYWDKLYKKAAELYGYDNVTIPTLTRPWIVPGEIIIRETADDGSWMMDGGKKAKGMPSAYIYKANLKVMLEQDYLKSPQSIVNSPQDYQFKDPRSKELNEYSTQLIRELIIPKLTKEVNSSKRYAALRQVYYSLILSRWFKLRFSGKTGTYASLINTRNLANLISKESWSKTDYFKQYQKSFSDGEYNIKEPVYTPTGQVIRSYFSGGIAMSSPITDGFTAKKISPTLLDSGVLMEGDAVSGMRVVAASPLTVSDDVGPVAAAKIRATELGALDLDHRRYFQGFTPDIFTDYYLVPFMNHFYSVFSRYATLEEVKDFYKLAEEDIKVKYSKERLQKEGGYRIAVEFVNNKISAIPVRVEAKMTSESSFKQLVRKWLDSLSAARTSEGFSNRHMVAALKIMSAILSSSENVRSFPSWTPVINEEKQKKLILENEAKRQAADLLKETSYFTSGELLEIYKKYVDELFGSYDRSRLFNDIGESKAIANILKEVIQDLSPEFSAASPVLTINKLKMNWYESVTIDSKFKEKIEQALRDKILLQLGDGDKSRWIETTFLCPSDDYKQRAFFRLRFDALLGQANGTILVDSGIDIDTVALPVISLAKDKDAASPVEIRREKVFNWPSRSEKIEILDIEPSDARGGGEEVKAVKFAMNDGEGQIKSCRASRDNFEYMIKHLDYYGNPDKNQPATMGAIFGYTRVRAQSGIEFTKLFKSYSLQYENKGPSASPLITEEIIQRLNRVVGQHYTDLAKANIASIIFAEICRVVPDKEIRIDLYSKHHRNRESPILRIIARITAQDKLSDKPSLGADFIDPPRISLDSNAIKIDIDELSASSAVQGYVDIEELRSLNAHYPQYLRLDIGGEVVLVNLDMRQYPESMQNYLIFDIHGMPTYSAYLGNNLTIGQCDVIKSVMRNLEKARPVWTASKLLSEIKQVLSDSPHKPSIQELPSSIVLDKIVGNKIKLVQDNPSRASSAVQAEKEVTEEAKKALLADLRKNDNTSLGATKLNNSKEFSSLTTIKGLREYLPIFLEGIQAEIDTHRESLSELENKRTLDRTRIEEDTLQTLKSTIDNKEKVIDVIETFLAEQLPKYEDDVEVSSAQNPKPGAQGIAPSSTLPASPAGRQAPSLNRASSAVEDIPEGIGRNLIRKAAEMSTNDYLSPEMKDAVLKGKWRQLWDNTELTLAFKQVCPGAERDYKYYFIKQFIFFVYMTKNHSNEWPKANENFMRWFEREVAASPAIEGDPTYNYIIEEVLKGKEAFRVQPDSGYDDAFYYPTTSFRRDIEYSKKDPCIEILVKKGKYVEVRLGPFDYSVAFRVYSDNSIECNLFKDEGVGKVMEKVKEALEEFRLTTPPDAESLKIANRSLAEAIMYVCILFGGNWKERKDLDTEEKARAKAREFKAEFENAKGLEGAEIVIFPEAKWIRAVAEELAGTNIKVGVQSLFFGNPNNPDDFTPVRLQEKIDQAVRMRVRYANVGHSMHRKLFVNRQHREKGEPEEAGLTDKQANKIMKAILKDGRLIPWYTIEICMPRQGMSQEEIATEVERQIHKGVNTGLDGISKEELLSFPITPEPSDKISTPAGDGKVKDGIQVSEEDTALVRLVYEALEAKYGSLVFSRVNTGYGASVKGENAQGIFANEKIRNALVGGASLEAASFLKTVQNGMKGKAASPISHTLNYGYFGKGNTGDFSVNYFEIGSKQGKNYQRAVSFPPELVEFIKDESEKVGKQYGVKCEVKGGTEKSAGKTLTLELSFSEAVKKDINLYNVGKEILDAAAEKVKEYQPDAASPVISDKIKEEFKARGVDKHYSNVGIMVWKIVEIINAEGNGDHILDVYSKYFNYGRKLPFLRIFVQNQNGTNEIKFSDPQRPYSDKKINLDKLSASSAIVVPVMDRDGLGKMVINKSDRTQIKEALKHYGLISSEGLVDVIANRRPESLEEKLNFIKFISSREFDWSYTDSAGKAQWPVLITREKVLQDLMGLEESLGDIRKFFQEYNDSSIFTRGVLFRMLAANKYSLSLLTHEINKIKSEPNSQAREKLARNLIQETISASSAVQGDSISKLVLNQFTQSTDFTEAAKYWQVNLGDLEDRMLKEINMFAKVEEGDRIFYRAVKQAITAEGGRRNTIIFTDNSQVTFQFLGKGAVQITAIAHGKDLDDAKILTKQLYYQAEERMNALLLDSLMGLSTKSDTAIKPSVGSSPMTTGGIDFRSLPMTIQPMGSFVGLNFKLPKLSKAQLDKMIIDTEMQQIKNMIKSGMLPSGERIKELIAACNQKKELTARADNLLLCLVDICKLEEENAYESSPELREALVIVDAIS